MKTKTTLIAGSLAFLTAIAIAGVYVVTGFGGAGEAAVTPPSDDDVPSLNLPPEERDPDRLWCTEHSRYEDECYICHPDLRPEGSKAGAPDIYEEDGHHDSGDHDTSASFDIDDVPSLNLPADQREPGRLWCREHDRYEDECYICHPDLMSAATLSDERHDEIDESGEHGQAGQLEKTRESRVLWCDEHDVAENECGICQPQLLANLDFGSGLKVRLADPSSVDQAGVSLGRPKEGGSSAMQTMLGEVSYNRNQLAIVTPLGSGVIMDVLVEAGDEVASGQLLATLNSPAVAEAKSVLLKAVAEASLAQKTYAREKDLYTREISARKDLEEAQSVVATTESEIDFAAQRLLNLGLTSEELNEVRRTRSTSSRLEVRAPFDGTVVERLAVKGTAVEVGSPLFHVADLSTVWMKLSMSETQLMSVEEGQTINAQFDAYPGLMFQGEISWIAPSIDHRTRTFEARVVLPNQHGMLKDGLFGEVSLTSGTTMQGLHVPESAVQEVDGQSIVFARLDQDLFETRLVRLGQKRGDQVQVLGGLASSDEIAFDGSYLLKSEFLKARLGAGCADD